MNSSAQLKDRELRLSVLFLLIILEMRSSAGLECAACVCFLRKLWVSKKIHLKFVKLWEMKKLPKTVRKGVKPCDTRWNRESWEVCAMIDKIPKRSHKTLWLFFKIPKYSHKTLWLVFKIPKCSHKMLWLVFKIPKYSHRMLWLVFKIPKYSHKTLLDGFFFDGCFLDGFFLDGCFCFRDFRIILTLFLLTLNKSVNFKIMVLLMLIKSI